MIKKKENQSEKSITESFLGGIPFLGGFFKELGKTETFRKKFAETDDKIKENLRQGEKRKWGFEANISVRPIMHEVKKETSELSIHEDYFYGRKGNILTFVVKVPQEKVHWLIKGKYLLITADNFEKKIELSDYYREIKKKQYQDGLLVLELTK